MPWSPGREAWRPARASVRSCCSYWGRNTPRYHPTVARPSGSAPYCEENDIPVDGFTPMIAKSEDVLPNLELDAELDLIIVDGNHAFPAPMVDWFYMTRHLRTGGVLVVDDVELWTGAVLADFLDGEAGVWLRLARTKRFAIYRLLVEKRCGARAQLGRTASMSCRSSDLSMIGNPHAVQSSRHAGPADRHDDCSESAVARGGRSTTDDGHEAGGRVVSSQPASRRGPEPTTAASACLTVAPRPRMVVDAAQLRAQAHNPWTTEQHRGAERLGSYATCGIVLPQPSRVASPWRLATRWSEPPVEGGTARDRLVGGHSSGYQVWSRRQVEAIGPDLMLSSYAEFDRLVPHFDFPRGAVDHRQHRPRLGVASDVDRAGSALLRASTDSRRRTSRLRSSPSRSSTSVQRRVAARELRLYDRYTDVLAISQERGRR